MKLMHTALVVLVISLCGCPDPPIAHTQNYTTLEFDPRDDVIIQDELNRWLADNPQKIVTCFTLNIQNGTEIHGCVLRTIPGDNRYQQFSIVGGSVDSVLSVNILQEFENNHEVFSLYLLPHSSQVDELWYLVCHQAFEENKSNEK